MAKFTKKQLEEFDRARAELDDIMSGLLTEKKSRVSDKHLLSVKGAIEKRSLNKNWYENRIAINKRLSKDPVWLANTKKSAEKRLANKDGVENHKKAMERLTKSKEWLEINKQVHQHQKKPIFIKNYGVFDSLMSAAKELNLTEGGLIYRIKTKPTEYYYITREEYEKLKDKNA